MAYIYVSLIQKGLKTLEDVPKELLKAVEELLSKSA